MAHPDFDDMTLQRCFASFNENWHIDFLSPHDMVLAGFFYSGSDDRVTCNDCNKQFFDWKLGDDPLQQHIRVSPNCSFIKEALSTVIGRLRTFNNWPVVFINPREMAMAGFFYTGKRDKAKCFTCWKSFDLWEDGDVPLFEHFTQSSFCIFMREFGVNFEKCGLYGSCIEDALSSYNRLKNIESSLNSEGIMQKSKPFIETQMTTFDARLRTFDKYLNINTFKQDINALCEAGFFYSGDGQNDAVTCFFCAITLSHWSINDEPWREHVRWSETCSYLLLTKSKNFVDQIYGEENYDIKSDQVELFNLIAEQKNTYIIGKMKVQMTKKYSNGIRITKSLFAKNQHYLSQILNPSSVPDSMLCKICYKEEIKTAFVPCGHTVACIECALTIKYCAICRYQFTYLMRVYLCMNEENNENLQLAPSNSKMSFSNTFNPMLCKVCHEEQMAALFLPCKHVYTCGKCAEEIKKCPICRENVFSFIKLYL